ncbi:DapH/DapD/GlmU-related protein [Priestia megaterium]|uniref:DapH/DapD/GlmU-related protein n=1 Tax=Priestia megaterium TaxID=1404 RepID=UPI003672AC66
MPYKLADWIPDPFKDVYRLISLRIIHKQAKIYSPYVSKRCKLNKEVRVGKDVYIGDNVKINDFTYVNKGTYINNANIGKYCSVSYNCFIGLNEHPIDFVSTSPSIYLKRDLKTKKNYRKEEVNKVIIENDVWIGANAIIKQGIKVGNGAVVGAGAVVTKDVEPYAIVVGNPAKLLKYRECKKDFSWWELDEEDLNQYIDNYYNLSI